MTAVTHDDIVRVFEVIVARAHGMAKAKGFWDSTPWNFGEKVSLIHSELSEALEADRKGGPRSEKIPEHTQVAEELADAIIRIADLCGHLGIDLGAAVLAKVAYNESRPQKHNKRY